MTAIELSAQLGLFAVWLLTFNIVLGLLLSVHYNPLKRWPHRRINYFTFHNWTGYIALGLTAAHVVVIPFSTTAGWTWLDALWPQRAPQQALENVLGALGLYVLTVVVATSYLRRRVGRSTWKLVHYASYVSAVLFYIHGIFLDPKLQNRPVDWFDAEKVSVWACLLLVTGASILRLRWSLRRRAAGRAKDQRHWDAPVPAEWIETA